MYPRKPGFRDMERHHGEKSGVTIPHWGIGIIAGVGVLLVLLLIVLDSRGGSARRHRVALGLLLVLSSG